MSPRLPVLWLLLILVAGGGLVAWGLSRWHSAPAGVEHAEPERAPQRIVSLSPGITEVLEMLGLSSRLVGISDYCAPPTGREPPPRLGSSLTPSYEAILTVRPDLILTQTANDAPLAELEALAPTATFDWTTSAELVRGILDIGRLTHAGETARALAARVDSTLRRTSSVQDSSRLEVLFVLEHSPGQLSEAWYIKDDTIHGDALWAAGARNAIPPGDPGVPRISLERVIAIDPEAILILSTRDSLPAGDAELLLADWRRLAPIRAVKDGRVGIVTGDRLYVTGPRVLDLVDAIRTALRGLGSGSNGRGGARETSTIGGREPAASP